MDPIYVRDVGTRVPAEPLNEVPMAIITYEPEEPNAGDVITLDASQSQDQYGGIVVYLWSFGDGATMEGCSVEYSYSEGGVFIVNLTVIDDDGAEASNYTEIKVNDIGSKRGSKPKRSRIEEKMGLKFGNLPHPAVDVKGGGGLDLQDD